MGKDVKSRVESELEIKSYIQNLKYALDHGARIHFQAHRRVDEQRDVHYTNSYTIAKLFPDESPADVLRGGIRMKLIRTERIFCTCCMEEHDVKTVQLKEHTIFKNRPVDYMAQYYYCDVADEFYMDETMANNNDIRMKDVYRKTAGLLTSQEILDIRTKYGISQSDLCILLGWGKKTITRYESHQVQDKAHDTILKKLDEDPEWFIHLILEAKPLLPPENYHKYFDKAVFLYEQEQDSYLRKSIAARYVRFRDHKLYHGNAPLSLDKIVDIICYFADSPDVTGLYKVKLMKLMWYTDFLSYKLYGRAITGLVYQALPMGAVPIGHDLMIDLNGIHYEEIDMGDGTACRFLASEKKSYPSLMAEEKKVIDTVITKLGKMSTKDIVAFMHQEQAYRKTAFRDIISFQYADTLLI